MLCVALALATAGASRLPWCASAKQPQPRFADAQFSQLLGDGGGCAFQLHDAESLLECLRGTHLVVVAGSQMYHAVVQLLYGTVSPTTTADMLRKGDYMWSGSVVDVLWLRAAAGAAVPGALNSSSPFDARRSAGQLTVQATVLPKRVGERAPFVGKPAPPGTVARLTFLPARFPVDIKRWLARDVVLPGGGGSGEVGGLGRSALYVGTGMTWYNYCAAGFHFCPRDDLKRIRARLPPMWRKAPKAKQMSLVSTWFAREYAQEYGRIVDELMRLCNGDRILCMAGRQPHSPDRSFEESGLPNRLRKAADGLLQHLGSRVAVADMQPLTAATLPEAVKGHWSNVVNAWVGSYLLAPVCAWGVARPAGGLPFPGGRPESARRFAISPSCYSPYSNRTNPNGGCGFSDECLRTVLRNHCSFSFVWSASDSR
jgi:hypothetical protein